MNNKESFSVLIYYPNRILLQRLVQFVQAAGYETLTTSDEAEALELARSMHPDIFLLVAIVPADLGIANELRARYPHSRLVVLAETDDMAERAQEAGIDEVVLYEEADIGNVLEAIRQPPRTAPPASVEDSVAVLIVDDAPDTVEMLSEYLNRSGYRSFAAENGRAALEILNTNRDIRVVLLDIMMPDIGGLEVLGKIRELRPAPAVIMLTALSDSVIARHALKNGASDYLVKPINLSRLDQAITACAARWEYRNRHWWSRRKA